MPGVDQAHHEPSARESGEGHTGTHRNPDHQADQRGAPGDLERQEGDPQHLRVQGDQEPEGLADTFKDEIHVSDQTVSVIRARVRKT